jgi:hypothetical protein
MDLSPPSIEVLHVVSGSFARETVLDAFLRNPGMTWTAAGLSSWYRIRLDLVSAILGEFVEERIVRCSPGRPDRYTLSVEEQHPSNAIPASGPRARVHLDGLRATGRRSVGPGELRRRAGD